MTEPLYRHAHDDAPLYRVSAALGGRAWPAYRAYEDKVVLDVSGDLVTFLNCQVAAIARPEGLPDWVIALVRKAERYEEVHGDVHGDESMCFDGELHAIPAEVRQFIAAWAEAAKGASS